MQRLKHIGTDILGVLLIVAAGLFGWIPGPGGIPLFIAGLALLAINHEWARRWLKKAKAGGLSLSGKIFHDHPAWRLAIDVVGLAMFMGGIWLLAHITRNFMRGIAIAVIVLGLSLILGNRDRLKKLLTFFNK